MEETSQPPFDSLAHLRRLHPDYSDQQLLESRRILREYFDLAWQIAMKKTTEQEAESNSEEFDNSHPSRAKSDIEAENQATETK